MGPRAGLDMVRKISPPPEFDPRTVQPVASVGDDNTMKYINTIKTHFLVCNTFYAQNALAVLHFPISFNSSLSPHLPSLLFVFPTGTQSRTATDVCTRSTECRLLCCRVTNRPFSASDWLRVRSFVLDLQRGLSWIS